MSRREAKKKAKKKSALTYNLGKGPGMMQQIEQSATYPLTFAIDWTTFLEDSINFITAYHFSEKVRKKMRKIINERHWIDISFTEKVES